MTLVENSKWQSESHVGVDIDAGDDNASPVQPLIGREKELAFVRGAMTDAADGRGRCLAIVGEAGVGKTRLADECMRLARDLGHRTAWGGAWRDAPPFWPWHDVLRQLGASKIADHLDGTDRHDAAAEVPELFSMFRDVADAVLSVSLDRPVLIVLDDAHVADLATMRLSRFVARSIRRTSATLLLTSRLAADGRQYGPSNNSPLVELLSAAESIVLGGLSLASIRTLVAQQAGGVGDEAVDAMARDLAELTGGIPLFLHEALAQGTSSVRTAPSELVGGLLGHRLAGLDGADMAVLGAGAVLGPNVTVHEITMVSASAPEDVRRTLERAKLRGLLAPTGECVFMHGLLREALLRQIGAGAVCDLQQRGADALELHDAGRYAPFGRSSRIARLLLDVARHRGGDAVAAAVSAARRAVSEDRQLHGAVGTASMLQDLVTVVEDHGQMVPVDLLVELARAELAGGNVRSARHGFDRAIGIADDPTAFSLAVLGRGELAVFEHRSHQDVVDLEQLVEQARQWIGDRNRTLRLRLDVLAARERWMRRRGPIDDVVDAVDAVRANGAAAATADALSSLHHVLLGPEHTKQRQEIVIELLALAPSLGDAFLALNGSMWRTVDLFLDGDSAALRSLRDLHAHADALRARSVAIVADRIEVMLLIRAGRFESAADAAKLVFDQASSFGDADAFGYYAGHLMAIHWIKGSSGDLLEMAQEVAEQPTLLDGDEIYTAGFAAIAAQAGGSSLSLAAAMLDRIEATGLHNLPVSSNWLVTLQCLGEAAIALDRSGTCEVICSMLEQYADLPVMGSMGAICVGPAARIVGLLHLACGRSSPAILLLEEAHVVAKRLEDRPFAAIVAGDLGLALLRRSRSSDLVRSAQLVDEALAAMFAFGMDRRADRLVVERSRIAGDHAGHRRLWRTDDGWEFRGLSEAASLPNAKGCEYLAILLDHPNVEMAADDLAGTSVASLPQDVWDGEAIGSLRRHTDMLREQLERADIIGDAAGSERAERELNALLRSIHLETRANGSSRAFTDTRERARTAVTKAISRALRLLAEEAPNLAAELRGSIRTGRVCRFEQLGSTEWAVEDGRSESASFPFQ